jgi:hypothetical protein
MPLNLLVETEKLPPANFPEPLVIKKYHPKEVAREMAKKVLSSCSAQLAAFAL